MPAVRAIANAPQNVRGTVARGTIAPPALAAIALSKARNPKDANDAIRMIARVGERTAISKGTAAPTENAAPDVIAACTGRAAFSGVIPSYSRARAPKHPLLSVAE